MFITAVYSGKEYLVEGLAPRGMITLLSSHMVDSSWMRNSNTGHYEKKCNSAGLTLYKRSFCAVFDRQTVDAEEFNCKTLQCYIMADNTDMYSSDFNNVVMSNRKGRDIRFWTGINKFDYFVEKKSMYMQGSFIGESQYSPMELIEKYREFFELVDISMI